MSRIFTHPFTVSADAIDVHRHVNNIEYLRWMQDVAIAHSTDLGWPMARYLKERYSWYIRSHFIEYLRPAKLNDALHLLTWVADLDECRSTRKYLFWRPEDHQIIARAETAWVFVDIRSGLPRPVSDAVREAFPIVTDETEVQACLHG
jgi:acyl-CoA thioester hydrolase